MLGAAALVALISAAGVIAHAASAPGQSRLARALEPGFSGTFLYRNDNFRTGQNLAESVLTPSNVTASRFGLQFTDADRRCRLRAAALRAERIDPGPGHAQRRLCRDGKRQRLRLRRRRRRSSALAYQLYRSCQWNYRGAVDRYRMHRSHAYHRHHVRRPSSTRLRERSTSSPRSSWDPVVISINSTRSISRPVSSRAEQSRHDYGERARDWRGQRQRHSYLRSAATA